MVSYWPARLLSPQKRPEKQICFDFRDRIWILKISFDDTLNEDPH